MAVSMLHAPSRASTSSTTSSFVPVSRQNTMSSHDGSRSVRQSLDPPPDGIVELPPLVLRGRSRPVEIYCMASDMRLDLRPIAA